MNYTRSICLLTAAGALLVSAHSATATCSHSTRITNNSSITLRIAELKSSYAQPFFKSQWTGEKVIAPGSSKKIKWTSDLDCASGGIDNEWDVKLFRNNGKVHYCSELGPGQDVNINKPDLCFPQ